MRWLAVAALLSACSGSGAKTPATPASASAEAPAAALAIRDVRIFDGEKTIERGTVVVEGDRIVAVGPDVAVPAGAEVVDGTGRTLLPGLIDAHTHVIMPRVLEQALVFGVTTELDMFSDHEMAARLRDRQQRGKDDDRADIFSSGTLLTSPKGHGTEYGVQIPTVTGPEQAQAFVDARIAEGSDYIKIVYDDGGAYYQFETISKQTLAAAIDAAHARSKLAVVHIGSLDDARDAVEAGADGIAHLFLEGKADPAFAQLAAKRGAFVIDTLPVLFATCDPSRTARLAQDERLRPYLLPAEVRSLSNGFPVADDKRPECAIASETIKQLKAAGVPILASTDAPNPGTVHGASLHAELELLVESGLTPTEALTAATAAPARQFKLDDRGRIEVGKRADLVLVEGDPTRDITATRAIVEVWKRGVRLDRSKYRELVGKLQAAVEAQRSAPPPSGSEPGLVSDFENGKLEAAFGHGWIESTDSIMGGTSTVVLKVVPGGARRSKHALEIHGRVVKKEGSPIAWSGAMFAPGPGAMQPANLSAKKRIVLWVKGDPGSYTVMLFATSLGPQPARRAIEVGRKWKKVTLELAALGVEGFDLQGVFIGRSVRGGEFKLRIDDVAFE